MKFKLSMALMMDVSSSVRSTMGETRGAALVTSWCQVTSVFVTRFINIDPTCKENSDELGTFPHFVINTRFAGRSIDSNHSQKSK